MRQKMARRGHGGEEAGRPAQRIETTRKMREEETSRRAQRRNSWFPASWNNHSKRYRACDSVSFFSPLSSLIPLSHNQLGAIKYYGHHLT